MMRTASSGHRLARATLALASVLAVLTLARSCGWNPRVVLSMFESRVAALRAAMESHR